MELITTDHDLIKDIKKNRCSECISELRNRHEGLIVKIYSKYSSLLNSLNFTNDDFSQEIDELVYKASKNFDLRKRKIKFSSYLGTIIRYFCLNKITELKKSKIIETDPEKIIYLMDECYNNIHSDISQNKEMCDYIFNILDNIQDKRIPAIFNYRFFESNKKITWKEIGKKIGYSDQTCINLFRKGVNLIKKRLEDEFLS